jgi:hypothetical protein
MFRPFYDEAVRLYWILKGRTEQGIPKNPEVGQRFTLEKAALFTYPVGQILLVCNDEFEALTYAKILSFEQTVEGIASSEVSSLEQEKDATRVHCQIVKTLTSEEQISLSNHLQTTRQLMKESI